MTTWAGTTRASASDLADVREVGGQTTAVVATGEVASELRAQLAGASFAPDAVLEHAGEYAIIERGAVHAFVRVSPGATVILRDEEGYVERVSGETRMYPLEMVARAVMVVGIPSDQLDMRQVEEWLMNGAAAASLDRLVTAWGHYGVVIVEGWNGVDPHRTTLKTSRSQQSTVPDDEPLAYYTIPPLAMLTDDPLPERRAAVPMPYHSQNPVDTLEDVGTPTMDQLDVLPHPVVASPVVHAADDRRVLAALSGAVIVLVLFLMAGVGYAFLL